MRLVAGGGLEAHGFPGFGLAGGGRLFASAADTRLDHAARERHGHLGNVVPESDFIAGLLSGHAGQQGSDLGLLQPAAGLLSRCSPGRGAR